MQQAALVLYVASYWQTITNDCRVYGANAFLQVGREAENAGRPVERATHWTSESAVDSLAATYGREAVHRPTGSQQPTAAVLQPVNEFADQSLGLSWGFLWGVSSAHAGWAEQRLIGQVPHRMHGDKSTMVRMAIRRCCKPECRPHWAGAGFDRMMSQQCNLLFA
ncbi:hypothetical protein BD289DRAFT_452429 [Coniella lustricola]|uniref:Uncharacterized protein n=1 Tax=Coniella lustricola TaxID=2025994 RepID=A0A2T3ABD2_9PEZI|nr:hypothetical protein BD289DRAFT_452429 [Coniella lustricola]